MNYESNYEQEKFPSSITVKREAISFIGNIGITHIDDYVRLLRDHSVITGDQLRYLFTLVNGIVTTRQFNITKKRALLNGLMEINVDPVEEDWIPEEKGGFNTISAQRLVIPTRSSSLSEHTDSSDERRINEVEKDQAFTEKEEIMLLRKELEELKAFQQEERYRRDEELLEVEERVRKLKEKQMLEEMSVKLLSYPPEKDIPIVKTEHVQQPTLVPKIEPTYVQPAQPDPYYPPTVQHRSEDRILGLKSFIDLTYKAIPSLDLSKTTLEMEYFISTATEYFNAVKDNSYLPDSATMTAIKMKFPAATLRIWTEWRANDPYVGWLSISDLRTFIESQKSFRFDSQEAKRSLRNQNQYALKLTIREFWDHLKEIEARVATSERSHGDFVEAFVDGLDRSFRNPVRGEVKMYSLTIGGYPNKEWLILCAESKSANVEKGFKPQRPVTQTITTTSPIVVAAITPTGSKWPPLTEEERAKFRANNTCFYCRQQGHNSTNCDALKASLARKATWTAGSTGTVRTSSETMKSNLLGISQGGSESNRSKIVLGYNISNTPLSEDLNLSSDNDLCDNRPIIENIIEPEIVSEYSPTYQPLLVELVTEENEEKNAHKAQQVFGVGDVKNELASSHPTSPFTSLAPAPPCVTNNSDDNLIEDTVKIPKWVAAGEEKIFEGQIRQKSTSPSWTTADILYDTGSTGMLIDLDYCKRQGINVYPCTPREVKVADKKTFIINLETTVAVKVGKWVKDITFSVTPLPYDVIFGMPFECSVVIYHNDWKNKIMKFKTTSGSSHTWYGQGHTRSNLHRAVLLCSGTSLQHTDELFLINIREFVDRDDGIECTTRFDDGQTVHTDRLRPNFIETKQAPKTNKEMQSEFLSKLDPKIRVILEPFLDSVLSDPPHASQIPKRPEDQKITFQPGMEPRHQSLRRFSEAEDKLIKEHLDDLLGKGMIQVSNSPYGANIVFAKKKDGGLRLCIDYRLVNRITIKDRTPLPTHTEIRQRVRGAKFLTKIDIRDAFHMVRIDAPDCYKTAFQTRYGLFEYTVSPFGLSNSPAVFMKLMNRIFHDMTDRKLIFYVDDILIYSDNLDDHLKDIAEVFNRLKNNQLHVKLSKCEFAVDKLEWCGMEVSIEGFAIQKSQIEAMCDYPVYNPDGKVTVTTYAQQFLGSVRFFADFVPWLGEIASPLYELTKKDNKIPWGVEHQTVQRVLQHYLISAPQLKYFDPTLPTAIKTDASDYAIGGWLYQTATNGDTNIVAYWSRKLIPAETHYPVHERELLAIHDFVERFRVYLFGIEFDCYTDHKGLEHIQTQPKLSSRQVRWIQYLQDFNFTVEYLPGKANTFADWLSRRPDFADHLCAKCSKPVMALEGVSLQNDPSPVLSLTSLIDFTAFINDIQHYQEQDPFCQELEVCRTDPSLTPFTKKGYFKSFEKINDTWYYQKTCLVVPDGDIRLRLLEHFHDRVDHGHKGIRTTYQAMSQSVYWKSMFCSGILNGVFLGMIN